MLVNDYQFMCDVVAKFQHTLVVRGWFRHDQDWLVSVEIVGPGILAQLGTVGLEHPSVHRSDGRGCGFSIDCFRTESGPVPNELEVRFSTSEGNTIDARVLDLASERVAADESAALYNAFLESVRAIDNPTIIDVGGRDRSKFDRRVHFPGCTYIVVDVLPGANVDIVGDAHELSSMLPAESADAAISAYTFEHLLMPWKAAVELNRVLKPGGLICAMSHQALGLHDPPWDFWRFSENAWSGLFNRYTGFEIVETVMSSPQFIVPFFYAPHNAHAERSAGFEHSVVVARKTGQPEVDWPVAVSEVIDTAYPDTDDGHGG